MTGRYLLSPRAQADLESIWDYTADRWCVHQAELHTRQLWQHIAAVAAQPALGRACPEVRTGYFRFASGAHVLFYRPIEDGIAVIRILHQRMDFGRHF